MQEKRRKYKIIIQSIMNDSRHGNWTNATIFFHHSVEIVTVVCSIIYALIIVVSLLGNIAVCGVILRTRSLRRSVNACFILSLAVSDLMTTCLVTPFELELTISHGKWRHGEIMCIVYTTAYLLTVPTSILTLLALTFYRCRTLKDPLDRFKESPLMTRRRALLVVCILWAYSMLFSLAPVLGWKPSPKSVNFGYCSFNISRIYSVLSSMLNFVIPLLAASFINCRMYHLVLKMPRSPLQTGVRGRESEPVPFETTERNSLSAVPENNDETTEGKPVELFCHSPPTERQRRFGLNRFQTKITVKILKQRRNARAAKTTFLIVSSFIFCWLPWTLLSITLAFCQECPYTVPDEVIDVLLMLGFSNTAINPILYSFRSPEFKKAVREIIGNGRARVRETRL